MNLNDLKIRYSTASPKRQELRDRFQLIAASLGILLGFWETWPLFTGIYRTVLFAGILLAVTNIMVARFYKKFLIKFGDRTDKFLFRLNGIVMLITGIGFHITGSQGVKYAYYGLAFILLIVSPHFLLPAKNKKLVLQFNANGIIINRLYCKPLVRSWDEIASIELMDSVLHVQSKRYKKTKKYYIQDQDAPLCAECIRFISGQKTPQT